MLVSGFYHAASQPPLLGVRVELQDLVSAGRRVSNIATYRVIVSTATKTFANIFQ